MLEDSNNFEKMISVGDLFSMKDNNGEVKILEDDGEKFFRTDYSVQNEHSYSKNYELFNQGFIPEFNTVTIKTDSTFECKSCELDFATPIQLENHRCGCKKRNKLDGVDCLNKNLEEEVLEIDNYENYQTVKIQQKTKNIEQDPLRIEDMLEKFEIKKEFNEELTIKDEKSATHVDEINNYKSNQNAKIQQKKENVEKTSFEIEDTFEKFEIKKDFNEEFIIKEEKSETHESTDSYTHNKSKLYPCDVCDKIFSYRQNLNKHKRFHPIEKPHECDVCKRSFKFKCLLKQHKLSHTGEKPYECDVCNKAYQYKSELKFHKILHTNEKPYECDVCKKTFKFKYRLNQHRFIHTGEKPYECDVCKMTFNVKSNLKIHKLFHINEKPFECDICKKAFIQKSHLKYHKLLHTAEKPYKCDICEKMFCLKSTLERHKRVHTGEKPYACNFCEKAFSLKHNLNQHLRIHYRIK